MHHQRYRRHQSPANREYMLRVIAHRLAYLAWPRPLESLLVLDPRKPAVMFSKFNVYISSIYIDFKIHDTDFCRGSSGGAWLELLFTSFRTVDAGGSKEIE